MANKYEQKANDSLALSSLMTDRTKVSMKDLVDMYPEGIHVNGFEMVTTPNKNKRSFNDPDTVTYPVVTFEEDPGKYFFGGALMCKMCQAWIEMDGSEEAANAGITDAKPRIKFTKTRTANGNDMYVPTAG